MPETPREISCQELQGMILDGNRPVLVDCREPEEHALGVISGALLLPMSQIPQRQSDLAGLENRPVVVYCHHGIRSLQVAGWLQAQGFPEVQSLAGGVDAWARQIDPQIARY